MMPSTAIAVTLSAVIGGAGAPATARATASMTAIAIPGRETGAFALRADARRLARRDARLAAHHLRAGSIPRLDAGLPADTARRRAVQHLDLHAARGDRGKASTRRRARAARALTHGASWSAGCAAACRSRRRAPHRRAATPRLLVLQLPHLVLPAPYFRDYGGPRDLHTFPPVRSSD